MTRNPYILLLLLLLLALYPAVGHAEYDAEAELHPHYDPWSYLPEGNVEENSGQDYGQTNINSFTGLPREDFNAGTGLTDMVNSQYSGEPSPSASTSDGGMRIEKLDALLGWIPAGVTRANQSGAATFEDTSTSRTFTFQPVDEKSWKLIDQSSGREAGTSKVKDYNDPFDGHRSNGVTEANIDGVTQIYRMAPH